MSFFDTGGGGGNDGGGGGDIWTTGAFSFESPLKDLLDSGSFTLEDLLGEDELLQELRGMHPQLVEFFTSPGTVEGLVRYMIQEKPTLEEAVLAGADQSAAASTDADDGAEEEKCPIGDDEDDTNLRPAAGALGRPPTQEERDHYELRYVRYPYMACEVVCCEVEGILDALVSGTVSDSSAEGGGGAGNAGFAEEAMMEEIALTSSEDDNDASPSLELEKSASEEAAAQAAAEAGEEEKRPDVDGAADDGSGAQTLLDLMFSVLTETSALTLDDRRAGYLEKALSVLFRRRSQALTAYLGGDVLSSRRSSVGGGKIEGGKEAAEGEDSEQEKSRAAELMAAFFRQMHSHSVMQIAQRLLMPPPPGYAAARRASMMNADNGNSGESKNNHGENAFGAGLLGGGGWPNMMGDMDASDMDNDCGDAILDDDEDPTGMGGMLAVRAEWSDRPEAVDFLLTTLIGSGGSGDGKNDDVFFPRDGGKRPRGAEEDWEADEARLDASRHASDVLVSVVQNSTLDAGPVRALTSDPILGRIVDAIRVAAPPQSSSEDEKKETLTTTTTTKDAAEVFGPHESRATTAMSVLESLVLQLGGYGAVGGMPEGGGDEFGDEMGMGGMDMGGGMGNVGMGGGGAMGEGKTPEGEAEAGEAADASALIAHLPPLLQSLSALLTHPGAARWTSSVQYSHKPAALLGTSRLRVVRLLESLVLLGDARVDALLAHSDALADCLDLFWAFPWCSMLHQSVANLLVHVLEGGDARGELQEYFLRRCDLVGKLVDSFFAEGERGEGEGENEGGAGASSSPEGAEADGSSPAPGVGVGRASDGAMTEDGKPASEDKAETEASVTPLGDAAATLAADLQAIAGAAPAPSDGDAAETPTTPPIDADASAAQPPSGEKEKAEEPPSSSDTAAAVKTGPRYSEMMFALKTYRGSATSSVESERGSSVGSATSDDDDDEEGEGEEERRRKSGNETKEDPEGDGATVLPVSDDDVDAAMEKEGLEREAGGATVAAPTATATTTEEGNGGEEAAAVTLEAEAPAEASDAEMAEGGEVSTEEAKEVESKDAEVPNPEEGGKQRSERKDEDDDEGPPFRMGYMGHVIIICQALVHACTATDEDGGGQSEGEFGQEDGHDNREPFDARSKDSFDAEVELAVLPHLNGEAPSDDDEDVLQDGEQDDFAKDRQEEEEAESRKRKDRPSPEADDVKREGKKTPSVEETGDALARTSLEPEQPPLSSSLLPVEEPSSHAAEETSSEELLEDLEVESPLKGDPSAASSQEQQQRGPCIVRLMRSHPLHARWQAFVTTTLASETAVQSTPLGGYASAQGQDDAMMLGGLGMGGGMGGMGGGVDMQSPGALSEGEFVGEEGAVLEDEDADQQHAADAAGIGIVVAGGLGFVGPGGGGGQGPGGVGVVAGSIDLDDADLDIAASMMEALSLPPSHGGGGGPATEDGAGNGGGGGGHVRGQHRIITPASFGSVIQMPPSAGGGGAQYVYDDPLGAGRNPGFDDDESGDDDDCDAEEKRPGAGNTNEQAEEEGADETGVEGGADEDLSSEEEEGEEDKDDEDVPVIDLFAGNFSFQESSAASGEGEPPKGDEAKSASDDTVGADGAGWANFANFDDAFAASALPEPTPLAEPPAAAAATSSGGSVSAAAAPEAVVDAVVAPEAEAFKEEDSGNDGGEDPFGDTPHLVDALANDDLESDDAAAPPGAGEGQDDGRI